MQINGVGSSQGLPDVQAVFFSADRGAGIREGCTDQISRLPGLEIKPSRIAAEELAPNEKRAGVRKCVEILKARGRGKPALGYLWSWRKPIEEGFKPVSANRESIAVEDQVIVVIGLTLEIFDYPLQRLGMIRRGQFRAGTVRVADYRGAGKEVRLNTIQPDGKRKAALEHTRKELALKPQPNFVSRARRINRSNQYTPLVSGLYHRSVLTTGRWATTTQTGRKIFCPGGSWLPGIVNCITQIL